MGTWAAGRCGEPGSGHRRTAGRRERHRPCLPERRAGTDGRLRRPGRGDGEADHRNAVSERRGGPDQGRPAHVGRDQRPHQPPRTSSGGGRAAAGQLRGARGGGGRERRGPCDARGPGRHRSPDRPRQPPRLLRAAPRRCRARPSPRPPAQPGDHRPGLLQARQRLPRPSHRRPGARGGRRPAARADPRRGHAGPGRRRGVRLAPARERRPRGLGGRGAGADRHLREAVHGRGPGDDVGRNRRAVARSERQRARPRRRRRPLLGQGRGARRLRALLAPSTSRLLGRPPRGRLGAPRPERRPPAGHGPRAARPDPGAVGEFTDGREVWRYLDGDGAAFGMRLGEGRPAWRRPTVRGWSRASCPTWCATPAARSARATSRSPPRRASGPTSGCPSRSPAARPTECSAA